MGTGQALTQMGTDFSGHLHQGTEFKVVVFDKFEKQEDRNSARFDRGGSIIRANE